MAGIQKVCIVTCLAGPGSVAGGVWEVVVNQATALRDSGCDVSIVAGWLGADPPRRLRGLDVELVPARPLVRALGLRGLVAPGWVPAVRRALAGADIAHVHLCRDFLTMTATRAVGAARVPLVAQTHGMLAPARSVGFRLFDGVLTGPALRSTQHFITLTDDEKPALRGLGVPAQRISTIQNSVPVPPVAWNDSETPVQRLLFASRLHPRKQVLVFAETVIRLRRQGYPVEGIVAGPDQGDLATLRELIKRSGSRAFLKYAGELDRSRLLDELCVATAFVFPARDEPFGLVLVEALSVGTPVVSTTATPLAHLLANAGAAELAAPTAEAFATAVARVLDDAGLRASLSANGRALYEANWTNEAMVKDLTSLYANVSAGAR